MCEYNRIQEKMKLKYNINFRLEKRRNKDTGQLNTENLPINLDFTYEGKRFAFYTGYRVDESKWLDSRGENEKVQRVKKNVVNADGVQYNHINARLDNIKSLIEKIYIQAKANNLKIDNTYLRIALNKELGEGKTESTSNVLFWSKWEQFLATHKVSELRIKQFKSTKSHLQRFENQTKNRLSFDNITPSLLAAFESFLLEDHSNKKVYQELKKNRIPRRKSQNTVSHILKRFRAFLNWCALPQNGAVMKGNPFSQFEIKGEVYGAPICMTRDERDYLYEKEISNERIARVRDIFCFQCFVGCRVGDLYTFTQNDIVDNVLIYYPNKTKADNRTPARVPLSNKAKTILSRYDLPDGKLLPYISGQKYNDYIKELFEEVGLDRIVTQFNPLTMQKEQLPLHKVASSHLARRTFIHLLHTNVKDSVIASMSGHVKGSKAFDRYYEVDDNTRRDAINKYLD